MRADSDLARSSSPVPDGPVGPPCHGGHVTSSSELGLLRLVAQRIAGPAQRDRRRGRAAAHRPPGPGLPGRRSPRWLCAPPAAGEATSRPRWTPAPLVRSWPLRGTPAPGRRRPTCPGCWTCWPARILAGAARRRQRAGAAPTPTRSSARAVATRRCSVADAGLRRDALLAAFADGGVDVTGQRGYHLLWYLAQTGTVCLGPTDGGSAAVRPARRMGGFPAAGRSARGLGELAQRYFTGHGPATVRDFAAVEPALTLGDARSRAGDRGVGAGGARARRGRALPGTGHAGPARRVPRGGTRGASCCPGSTSSCSATATAAPSWIRGSPSASCPAATACSGPTVVSEGRIVGTLGLERPGGASQRHRHPVHRIPRGRARRAAPGVGPPAMTRRLVLTVGQQRGTVRTATSSPSAPSGTAEKRAFR